MAKQEDVREEPRRISQNSHAKSPLSTYFELDDLVRAALGQRFKVGEQLRDEDNENNNHFVAFEVHQDDAKAKATANSTSGLVARIYDMSNLTPKHKRYKVRSINRSAARTVFNTTWNSCQIIILKPGSLDNPKSSSDTDMYQSDIASLNLKLDDEHSRPSLATLETRAVSVSKDRPSEPRISYQEQNQTTKTKTNYQRESFRLRQRDRRAAKRRRQRLIATRSYAESDPCPPSLSETFAFKEIHGITDETWTMLMILHFDFNIPAEFEEQLPLGWTIGIRMFQSIRRIPESPIILCDDERVNFVQLKEKELVYLRRLKGKIHRFIQQCSYELIGLLEQQRLTTEEPPRPSHLHMYLIESNKRWHEVLLSASTVLSKLITESEKMIGLLNRDIKEASELRGDRRLLTPKQWIYYLIPGSEAFKQLFFSSQYS